MIKAILADDYGVVRAGLRCILEREPDITVVAEADDGWRALAAVEAHPEASVLVLDLGLPRLGGMEVLRRLRERRVRPAVLVFSGYCEQQVGPALQSLGAAGFLCKDRGIDELKTAVRAVAAGRSYFARAPAGGPRAEQPLGPIEQLSPREMQVLTLLLDGRSVTAIAAELGVMPSTISTYVANIKEKFGVDSVAGIIRYACAAGLIAPVSLGAVADRAF